MVLKIDTTNKEEIKVQLASVSGKKDEIAAKQKLGSQALLPLIVKILKKNKKKLENLTAVEVNIGPGSFTGTRVGVSVANALGFALDIPVNGSLRSSRSSSEAGQKGKIVLPVYQKSKFDD